MTEILLILLVLAFLVVIWLLLDMRKKGEDSKAFDLILQQINEVNRNVDSNVKTQFGESQRLIKETTEQVSRHLTDVTRSLVQNQETGKQVLSIADQLQNLEKVLKHQKQRGNLGEASLELILNNILPPTAFKLQYTFEDGDKVDALILTKEGTIPVDAKFSLDNYNRIINEKDEIRREELEKEFKNDLKKRIDETSKYIKTKEGTLPFAFMFIPAEAIFYDLLVNEVGSVKSNTRSLIDYAYNDKKVIVVSPTTFSAYLQSVLYGFNAYKIEKSAEQIKKNVEGLGKHIKAYDQFMSSLGKSLGTTVNHYNKSYKELQKIDKDVFRITGESAGIEGQVVDSPQKEED